MDFQDSPAGADFRREVRSWLLQHLVGDFAHVPADGLVSDDHWEIRAAWERELAGGGWIGVSWPEEHGGRGATLEQQVIFNVEYAKANAPTRISIQGEGLLGPTLIAFGTPAQQQRFLPPILSGEELWCQGYSEPDAGSDLANVRTRAVLDGDRWVITGQKTWTTLAHRADWCYVLCRTDPRAERHGGLSYLLVPMRQPGVAIRPIRQLTGTTEFSEVFFDEAVTDRDNVVGPVDGGWRIAMATLGFERGTATLAAQLGFAHEYWRLHQLARKRGVLDDPVVRQRFAAAYAGLEIIRYNSLRMLSALAQTGRPGPEASIGKLLWSTWHQRFGELAMDVLGADATVTDDCEIAVVQRSFLASRAETIYAGSSEIQRNVLAERVVGLPR